MFIINISAPSTCQTIFFSPESKRQIGPLGEEGGGVGKKGTRAHLLLEKISRLQQNAGMAAATAEDVSVAAATGTVPDAIAPTVGATAGDSATGGYDAGARPDAAVRGILCVCVYHMCVYCMCVYCMCVYCMCVYCTCVYCMCVFACVYRYKSKHIPTHI